MPIEDYYSGDLAFTNLASCYDIEWDKCQIKDQLIEIIKDHDLAKLIYGSFLDNSIEWLDTNVPALEGLTPKQCLESNRGILRLRECLMRHHRWIKVLLFINNK